MNSSRTLRPVARLLCSALALLNVEGAISLCLGSLLARQHASTPNVARHQLRLTRHNSLINRHNATRHNSLVLDTQKSSCSSRSCSRPELEGHCSLLSARSSVLRTPGSPNAQRPTRLFAQHASPQFSVLGSPVTPSAKRQAPNTSKLNFQVHNLELITHSHLSHKNTIKLYSKCHELALQASTSPLATMPLEPSVSKWLTDCLTSFPCPFLTLLGAVNIVTSAIKHVNAPKIHNSLLMGQHSSSAAPNAAGTSTLTLSRHTRSLSLGLAATALLGLPRPMRTPTHILTPNQADSLLLHQTISCRTRSEAGNKSLLLDQCPRRSSSGAEVRTCTALDILSNIAPWLFLQLLPCELASCLLSGGLALCSFRHKLVSVCLLLGTPGLLGLFAAPSGVLGLRASFSKIVRYSHETTSLQP